jgi:hypothetical protein
MAKFIKEISFKDPKTMSLVFMELYRHENGLMFAMDTKFLADRETEYELIIIDPYSELENPQKLSLESN